MTSVPPAAAIEKVVDALTGGGEKDRKDQIDIWRKRITKSNEAHEKWKKEYRVKDCRDYWRGRQRIEETDKQGDRLMIVNRIIAAVRTALPTLYFREPFVKVNASPARADTQAQQVDQRAQLLQDSGNAIVREPETMFQSQTFISLKEAFWAFGAVEVGYTADWVDNPSSAGKPPLEETEGQDRSPEAVVAELKQAIAQTVTKEKFYVRRIDPECILISEKESSILEELDWVGYSEEIYLEDVKKSPAYSNTEELSAKEGSDKILVYKLWDLRTNTRFVLPEGADDFILEASFKRVPLFFLRFEEIPGEFRPIPPIYSWLMSQDEYNDSREFLRKNRKARQGRYTIDPAKLTPEEAKKFESEDVSQYVFTQENRNDGSAIRPVEQPAMTDTLVQSLTISRSEFDEVSGKSALSRQVPTGDSATEANIVNSRQMAQENFDRVTVAKWLGSIAKELILQAVDKMSLTRWVMLNSDPFSDYFLIDGEQIARVYRQITFQQLNEASESLSWDVSVDIEALSPVTEAEKKSSWMQVLALMTNPGMARLMALSPELLKRTLDLHGIRSGREQAMIAQALGVQAQIEMQMAQAKAAGPGMVPPPAPAGVVPMPAGPGGPGVVSPPVRPQ